MSSGIPSVPSGNLLHRYSTPQTMASDADVDNGMLYAILTAVASSMSFLGGIGICIIYFRFKELRTPSRKILLYLSLMDATTAFGNILGIIWLFERDSDGLNGNMVYCKIQSLLTIYSSISSFCWTVIMGLCLFMTIVMVNINFTSVYMKMFHAISWSLPGVISIVALSFDVLGYDKTLHQASWCWIDPTVPNAFIWQLFTGKVWEITAYVATCVLYFSVIVYIKRKSKNSMVMKLNRAKSRRAAMEAANRKLMFVPLVFIVCRIWGTLRFLIGNFAHDYANKPAAAWIVPMQGVGDSVQGFLNFILYCCMTDAIRIKLLRPFCGAVESPEISPDQTTRTIKHPTVDVL